MTSKIRDKYNLMSGKVIGAFLLMLLIGGALFSSVNASSNASSEYQKLMTYEEIDSLLFSYFSNLNVTEIYNTYNEYVTNEFYYYNQTFLNETFNEYITNEYYEDNYYNTYNEYNQTFLNQTFIDNDYYEYVTNNYINNSLLDDMMSSLNEIWDVISQSQDDKINIEESSDIINLNGSNCDKIEFMVKDSDILSVYDTLGLGISTQLAQVNNINLTNSFFIDNSENLVENGFSVIYDNFDTSRDAIETDRTKEMIVTSTSDTNLVGSEILINIAFQQFWEWDENEVFVISENGEDKLELYQKENNFYLLDLVTGNEVYVSSNTISNLANIYDDTFGIFKFVINSNSIDMYVEENFIMTLDSSPFDNSINPIVIKSTPIKSHNYYFRSIYVNSDSIEFISDEFVLNNDEIEYDRDNWLKGEIYILDDSVLYNIGNEIITQNYETGFEKEGYHLIIDKTRTSISNLYCRN